MKFTMDSDNFNKLLQYNLRWFDIVLYNLIVNKQQTIGVYDETYNEYDKETKTISHYKDLTACLMTDSQLADILAVKGNTQTRNKEISRSITRLEKAGFVKRGYTNIDNKKTRYVTNLFIDKLNIVEVVE